MGIKELIVVFMVCLVLTIYKIWFEKNPETVKEDRMYIDENGKLITLTENKIK